MKGYGSLYLLIFAVMVGMLLTIVGVILYTAAQLQGIG